MPTQKTFKRRVRARMTKTGESYTAARHQMLRKADEPDVLAAGPDVPAAELDVPAAELDVPAAGPEAPGESVAAYTTSEEAVIKATGRNYPDWFALLDEWGATGRQHGEIATWLSTEYGVPPWWTQAVTVSYERARGLRAIHEMKTGYTVGVTRTIVTSPADALAAFSDPAVRRQWLGDVELHQRRTTAPGNVRFDWPEPPSRLVVYAGPKGDGKTLVSVSHERLPDAAVAADEKAAWKDRLAALKRLLEM